LLRILHDMIRALPKAGEFGQNSGLWADDRIC
jgi:hypothetical protein